MAPSLCSQILGSDKLPGRTGTPLRSKVPATGPSPFPAGPWHGRQAPVNSSLPCAIDFGPAGVGFCFRAARAGAVQTSPGLMAAFCARLLSRPKVLAARITAKAAGTRRRDLLSENRQPVPMDFAVG